MGKSYWLARPAHLSPWPSIVPFLVLHYTTFVYSPPPVDSPPPCIVPLLKEFEIHQYYRVLYAKGQCLPHYLKEMDCLKAAKRLVSFMGPSCWEKCYFWDC